jgi:hypothetical protein
MDGKAWQVGAITNRVDDLFDIDMYIVEGAEPS